MLSHLRLSFSFTWLPALSLALVFAGCGGGGSSSGGAQQTPDTEQQTPPGSVPADDAPPNNTPDDGPVDNPEDKAPDDSTPETPDPGTPDPGTPDTTVNTYTIGGTLSGLNSGDTLTLQRDVSDSAAAELLELQENGVFQFDSRLPANTPYTVRSLSEPVGYHCLPDNTSGTVLDADISIAIHCEPIVSPPSTYPLSVQISGLNGTVELNLNQGEEILSTNQNNILPFSTHIMAGDLYSVEIQNQPTGQTCTLDSDSGIMPDNELTINVVCNTLYYSVGGTINGLGSNPVSLSLNGSETISTNAGTFRFTSSLAHNAQYQVQISSQPPLQRCSVALGSGYITADVNGIQVSCIDISPYAGSYQFSNPRQDPLAPVSFVVSESGQLSIRDQADNVSNSTIVEDNFAYQFDSGLSSTDVGNVTVSGQFQSDAVSMQICASDFSICSLFEGSRQ